MSVDSKGRSAPRIKGGNYIRNGFTLVEMLVVTGVIVLLAAMTLPALNRAKQKANEAQCLYNLNQIGLAYQTYAADADGRYPADNTVSVNTIWNSTQYLHLGHLIENNYISKSSAKIFFDPTQKNDGLMMIRQQERRTLARMVLQQESIMR